MTKISLNNTIATIFFLLLTFYFIYHAISGDRGVLAFLKLSQQVQKLQIELEQVRAERLYLDHKVKLMRSESLDLDLLDEQVRKLLGYAQPEESVIFLKKHSAK